MAGVRMHPPWLVRVLDAASQFANVCLLNGDPNESISGRAHRQRWVHAEKAIDRLIFWDAQHCRWAHLSDVARAQAALTRHEQRT